MEDKHIYCQGCGSKIKVKKLYKSSKCPKCGHSLLYWQPIPYTNPAPPQPPPEDEPSDQEEPNEKPGT